MNGRPTQWGGRSVTGVLRASLVAMQTTGTIIIT
jgi:hypothetical protein